MDIAVISFEGIGLSSLITPNAFTPNGNGKNDVFQLNAVNMTEFTLGIFDCWGLKIASL